MDKEREDSLDLFGKPYVPGYVGLNNIKATDYSNAVVQALNQVAPLRKYFLLNHFQNAKSELGRLVLFSCISWADTLNCPLVKVKRFGMLLRKMWNTKAFKGHVSPHEFVQVGFFIFDYNGKRGS